MSRNDTTPRWTPVQAAVLLVTAGLVAPPFFLAGVAAGLSVTVSAVVAALVLVILSLWSKRCVGPGVAIGRGQRLLFVIWMALGLLTAYKLASLSVFMLDVEKQEYAFNPTIRPSSDPKLEEPFFPKHNCFTCYVVGAHLASERVENVYLPGQYRDAEQETPIHQTIGDKVTIDRYQYPPPFLLLPKLLLLTGSDFFQVRTYWFALNMLVFGVTTLSLLLWIGRSEFSTLWLVFPFVLAAPATLGTLQIENAHFLMVMLSVAAMLAFEKNRTVWGGILLAFAIVSKLFPGLLLGYLVFRRRWRAVVSTGAAMIAFCALTLLVFGPAPFKAFISYQRPRLASGEAFSFAWEYIRPLVLNTSVMGVAYKLDKLGLLGGADPGGAARVITWAFSGLLLALTATAGLRHGRRVAGETDDHGSWHPTEPVRQTIRSAGPATRGRPPQRASSSLRDRQDRRHLRHSTGEHRDLFRIAALATTVRVPRRASTVRPPCERRLETVDARPPHRRPGQGSTRCARRRGRHRCG